MSVDLYSTRTMQQALIVAKRPRTFMREMMIRRDEYSQTEKVDVDIKVGQRRMAPFIDPNVGPGVNMDRVGFSTWTYVAPQLAPKRSLTFTDLQSRLPGESIYGTQTPDERAQILLGEDLAELDEAIIRAEEYMCVKAAFASAIPIVINGVLTQTITFPRASTVQIGDIGAAGNAYGGSSAAYWGASGANILTNIRAWQRVFTQQTGLTPDFMVCGQGAADALITAPTLNGITGLLNTRRADLGLIKPELMDGGATYIGRLNGTNIDIWGYDEWYIDPVTGTEGPLVPSNQILMGSSKAYCVMRYGAVGVATGVDQSSQLAPVAGARVPESWIEKEPAVRFIKINSRPLVVPVQNDAFLTAKVVP